MNNILKTLTETNKIYKHNDNLFEIETNVMLGGFKLRVFVRKDGDKILLTDNKTAIKFMNDLYELKSVDVKKCINDILKLYNFSISKGEIFAEVSKEELKARYMELIICISQLVNMYIFFDMP